MERRGREGSRGEVSYFSELASIEKEGQNEYDRVVSPEMYSFTFNFCLSIFRYVRHGKFCLSAHGVLQIRKGNR